MFINSLSTLISEISTCLQHIFTIIDIRNPPTIRNRYLKAYPQDIHYDVDGQFYIKTL